MQEERNSSYIFPTGQENEAFLSVYLDVLKIEANVDSASIQEQVTREETEASLGQLDTLP